MKRKIAILGGGASSLIAAWKLVQSDKAGDAYDITVYQMGWRLGGKGASGRRMDSPSDHRIEEHGLHFMFGFYANVFEVTRAAYEDVYDDPDMWSRFFKSEQTAITMIHFLDKVSWEPWRVPNLDSSGPATTGPDDDDDRASLSLILRNIWRWIRGIAQGAQDAHRPETAPKIEPVPLPPPVPLSLDVERAEVDGVPAPPPTFGTVNAQSKRHRIKAYWDLGHDFVHRLHDHAPNVADDRDADRHERLLDDALRVIEGLYQSADGPGAPAARLHWESIKGIVGFVTTVAQGLVRDLVVRRTANWFELDKEDFKDWMERHGGDRESPPVRGLYDAVFSTYKPLGAGSILQAFTKAAFLFEGGFLFKMQSGMGDTIFTPLYLALKKRNVKFEFFQRVENLGLSADKRHVDTIEIGQQIVLDAPYDPLVKLHVDIGGPMDLSCWPSAPLWDRLPKAQGDAIRREKIDLESGWEPRCATVRKLERGTHFDDVLLGISVAGVPEIAGELLAADPAFDRHVASLVMNTTATQGLQLWTTKDKIPDQPSPVIVPYTEPYDTVAEMTHLLGAEVWQHPKPARLYYLCSALEEKDLDAMPSRSKRGYPAQLRQIGLDHARRWCTRDAPGLWKNLNVNDAFDWECLHAPAGSAGDKRFEHQFLSTTTNLSDRYVIPGPNSYPHRLLSNGTKFANLYITGDWIRTSLSIGCLEAAAMAGVQAARAIALETSNPEIPRAKNDWIEDVRQRRRFIRRDGELFAQPPFEIEVTDLFLFVVEADSAKLKEMCDRELNLGPIAYAPMGDFVVFYGANIANRSGGAVVRTREMGVWVPVIAQEPGEEKRLLTYSPYVWIDSATSMHVGREIYGYPKLVGDVTVPSAGKPALLAAHADALARRGGENSVERGPIVTVAPDCGFTWERPKTSGLGHWLQLAKLVATLSQEMVRLDPKPGVDEVLSLMGGMRSVFLKQVPGPGRDGAADFQSIVEAAIVPRPATVSGEALAGRWTLTLPTAYTEPRVVENLGLRGGVWSGVGAASKYEIAARGQAWMEFEGVLGAGREVWRAS